MAKIQYDKRDKPITEVYSSFTPSCRNLVSHQTNVAGEVFADGTIWSFHHLFFTLSWTLSAWLKGSLCGSLRSQDRLFTLDVWGLTYHFFKWLDEVGLHFLQNLLTNNWCLRCSKWKWSMVMTDGSSNVWKFSRLNFKATVGSMARTRRYVCTFPPIFQFYFFNIIRKGNLTPSQMKLLSSDTNFSPITAVKKSTTVYYY